MATPLRMRGGHTLEICNTDAEALGVTGIERDDDPASGCWAALCNQANGVDIVATAIRQDGRWARLHNDSRVARIATGNFAHDHGLDTPS